MTYVNGPDATRTTGPTCTSEILSTMLEIDECFQCHKLRPVVVEREGYGDPFCSVDCLEAFDECANENAFDRQIENFYGGSSAVTLDEQHAAAYAEKRGAR